MAKRRELTANEEKFVKHIFGASISLDNTEIVSRVWLSGGFTPYGGIKMDPASYQADYIGPNMYRPPGAPGFDLAYLFLHELGHAWQHFTGAPMLRRFIEARAEGRQLLKASGRSRTAFNQDAATYSYEIVPAKPDLLDYNMEQQCEIIADYFSHAMWGRPLQPNQWGSFGYHLPTFSQLEHVLHNFIADPTYPKDGRWLWKARSRVRMVPR